MKTREFRPADGAACLALFDSNVPTYFHPAERDAFSECLNGPDFLPPRLRGGARSMGCFHVVEDGGVVIGCGGWYLDGTMAVLSWGMVAQSQHRKGIGRFLLQERLTAIRESGHVKVVRVHTTSAVQGFFVRAGFEVVRAGVKGIVDEMPLVELKLTL